MVKARFWFCTKWISSIIFPQFSQSSFSPQINPTNFSQQEVNTARHYPFQFLKFVYITKIPKDFKWSSNIFSILHNENPTVMSSLSSIVDDSKLNLAQFLLINVQLHCAFFQFLKNFHHRLIWNSLNILKFCSDFEHMFKYICIYWISVCRTRYSYLRRCPARLSDLMNKRAQFGHRKHLKKLSILHVGMVWFLNVSTWIFE